MTQQEVHRGEPNYSIGPDGRHRTESTRATFLTAEPHPSVKRDRWTGAQIFERAEPVAAQPTQTERRPIDDPIEAQMRATRMFSRTNSLEDTLDLAVSDSSMAGLAIDVLDRHFDEETPQSVELARTPADVLDQWAANHPESVIDLASEPKYRLAIESLTAYPDLVV